MYFSYYTLSHKVNVCRHEKNVLLGVNLKMLILSIFRQTYILRVLKYVWPIPST